MFEKRLKNGTDNHNKLYNGKNDVVFYWHKKSKKTWQKLLTSVLGNTIIRCDKKTWQFYLEVSIMNKDEILAKSRAENKNKDVYKKS